MPTRIVAPLTKEVIDNLILLSKYSPLGENFWQVTEDIVNNERNLKIFKCECENLFYISDTEYNKIDSLDDDTCFCKKFLKQSEFLKDILVESKLKEAAVMLKNHDKQGAMILCKDILPTDNFPSFDLAFWNLQISMSFNEYSKADVVTKRKMYQQQYFGAIFYLIDKATKNYKNEMSKLFDYFWERSDVLDEKIFNALGKRIESSDVFETIAYNKVTGEYSPTNHPDGTQNDSIKRSIQYFLDSYLAYVEITELYVFIINLLLILQGNPFRKDISNLEVTINGKQVKLKNKKGLCLSWILQNAPKYLSSKISFAINSEFRNDTSGHNDYIVDVENQAVKNVTNNHIYKFNYIREITNRLKSLVDAILSAVEIARYTDQDYLKLSGIHSMLIHFDENSNLPKNTLSVYQFWSNANLDKTGLIFNHATFKYVKKLLNGKDALLFSPNRIVPIPSKMIMPLESNLSQWLKEVVVQNKLILRRIVIAPAISYFKTSSNALYSDGYMNFYILGITNHELPIEPGLIKNIIKKINHKKNLASMKLSRIDNIIKLAN